jgi:hypothetical protein
MKNISVPVLALLISISLFVQPVAVCLAQYEDSDIERAMKGHHLYNLFGKDLGRIEGVQFDADGQPAFIVVHVLDKLVLVPFSALVPSSGINRFVVSLPQHRVRSDPGYSRNAFPYR